MMLESWHELRSSLLSHVNILTLVVFFSVYYLVYLYKKRRDFANIPPGPTPWPIVGNFGGFLVPSFVWKMFGSHGREDANAPSKSTAISIQFILMEQAKVYGNMYSVFIGSQLVVVLNGYEVVRDALLNRAEVFSDRPNIPAITILTKRKGKQLLCPLAISPTVFLHIYI